MARSIHALRKFVAPEFVFGVGARRLAGQYARNLGVDRVLLVTDPGVEAAGWADEAAADLAAVGVEAVRFSEVTPNPKDHEVEAGEAFYRWAGCHAIVAVGGGSPMDCAKGIGIVASNRGAIANYEGVDEVPAACPPLICVPTTAGTSADVSQFAIITDTAARYKMAIVSKAVVPDVSLVDPLTTTTMDRELTVNTGLDVLTHAVEALVSNASSPITELHALAAVRGVATHLLPLLAAMAEHDPRDEVVMEHRDGMMLASLQAGLAFSNASLGAIHAMAHALGGLHDLPHGECNALLLPYVIEYNYDTARAEYAAFGRALGIDLAGRDDAEQKQAVLDAVWRLRTAAGVTHGLADLGIERDALPALAETAMRDVCIVTNPRRPSLADLEALYAQAL